jgi:uncharacterized protein YndB with AHSA1/START domain
MDRADGKISDPTAVGPSGNSVMHSVIEQSVVLPAPAETLFEMYLNAASHAAITGFPVTISDRTGADFRAFNDQLSGRILTVVHPRLIVQSWRSTKFHAHDPDSLLVLAFSPDTASPSHGRIDLVHIDVPEHDYADVVAGWKKYYWEPWRAHLERG